MTEKAYTQEPEKNNALLNSSYDAPAFSVAPSDKQEEFQSCAKCHTLITMFPEMAEQQPSHTVNVDHGQGAMQCSTCHDVNDFVSFHSPTGEKLKLDQAHQVCGNCHGNRYRDWHFGAHGKRLNNWQGKRVISSCAHCHDPHSPAIKPRKPMPPPSAREGLEQPTNRPPAVKKPWDKFAPQQYMESVR